MTITTSLLFPSTISLVLFILLASTTPTFPTTTSSTHTSFQVDIEHMYRRSNHTRIQIIQRSLLYRNRRHERLNNLAQKPTSHFDFQSMISEGEGEFIMNLSIGTPPKHFPAIMDTGSDLIWTQCMPCRSCYTQPTPIFNPTTSASFSPLPCSDSLCTSNMRKCKSNKCKYSALYGDKSFSKGYLATETFSLGNSTQKVSIHNIGFGCGDNNAGTGLDIVAGIVGLGRGHLSLVSQLGAKKFSYCLPAVGENKKGTLSFGFVAEQEDCQASHIKGTPLLKNPALPSFYYIPLEGISLDNALLPINKSIFELKQDKFSGTILDSGTTITFLVEEAYVILKREFAGRTKLPVVTSPVTYLDLCFEAPPGRSDNIQFPKLKFHFKNMVLELPKENYLVDDKRMKLVCLGIMPSPGASIFGVMQQQNFLVLHDLEKQTVSFSLTSACT